MRKRHEHLVVLLDDCICSAAVERILKAAGFSVEIFDHHFPDAKSGKRQQGIKDDHVIPFCCQRGFILFTTDRNMKTTHVELLKKHPIGVIATASNNDPSDIWANAFVRAKAKIERAHKKEAMPFFAILQKSGALQVDYIGVGRTSRRTRPSEHSRD